MIRNLFILLLIAAHCTAAEISEKTVLEKFLRHLFAEAEAGYVLYDQKPVSITGFPLEDSFSRENDPHRQFVTLKEGAAIWKTLDMQSDKYLIHVYDKKDDFVNYYHVLIINKPLFLKVVKENLILFQYVLGPEVTPEKLLATLTAKESTFDQVLKEDRVLIGILLGFGTQNSLYGSRIENIQDMLFSKETMPFKPKAETLGFRKDFQEIVFYNAFKDKKGKCESSFGFHSIEQEMKDLHEKLDISSLALTNDPPFVYGRLKDDEESIAFVKEVEKTQLAIRNLLQREDFLDFILAQMYPESNPNLSKNWSQGDVSKHKEIVATAFWNAINDEGEEYRKAFFEGCTDCEKNISQDISDHAVYDYWRYNVTNRIKNNILSAQELMEKVKNDGDYEPIIADKLYYKVLREGNGEGIKDNREVEVHFTIRDQSDEVLKDTHYAGPETFVLNDVISGLRMGMTNMKEKEIREIIIHPSLAYGLYTTNESGVALKIQVELRKISDKISELDPVVYAKMEMPVTEFDEDKIVIEAGRKHGYNMWQHYKRQPYFTLEELKAEFNRVSRGENVVDIHNKETQDLVNKLHWVIYNTST